MSKYSSYSTRQDVKPIKRELHPIWRGVGFALIVITPILAYAGMLVLLDANKTYGWVHFTKDMISPIIDPYLYIKIGLTLLLMFLFYGIFMLITFILYSILAPPRYGPYDVPPVQYRGKRYKR